MSDPTSRLFLPVIALAEACHVVARGHTAIPTLADLLADVDADPRIMIVASIARSWTCLCPLLRLPRCTIASSSPPLAGWLVRVRRLRCSLATATLLLPA